MKTPFENKKIINKGILNIVHRLGKKIEDLFRLEEVEVTFDDKESSYRYTKISQS